ncbi:YgaP family membrane protein [Pseudoduganella sp. OTU4001]|uniref:YgaP family membrane protein n=1 Tax=Pseudoduganella sp. OTU4001 TaxID=3043854 RepID=UPI00406D4856
MTIIENVGTVDRALRIAVGVGLIAAALLDLIGPWGWIGVVPLLTGAIKFCPLYRLVRIRTNDHH